MAERGHVADAALRVGYREPQRKVGQASDGRVGRDTFAPAQDKPDLRSSAMGHDDGPVVGDLLGELLGELGRPLEPRSTGEGYVQSGS